MRCRAAWANRMILTGIESQIEQKNEPAVGDGNRMP